MYKKKLCKLSKWLTFYCECGFMGFASLSPHTLHNLILNQTEQVYQSTYCTVAGDSVLTDRWYIRLLPFMLSSLFLTITLLLSHSFPLVNPFELWGLRRKKCVLGIWTNVLIIERCDGRISFRTLGMKAQSLSAETPSIRTDTIDTSWSNSSFVIQPPSGAEHSLSVCKIKKEKETCLCVLCAAQLKPHFL